MFSRFRMSPIVEIQGSDWDWLRLIVSSGTVRYMWWKVERKTLTSIQFRTIDSSYHWVQLPAWWTNGKKKKTQLTMRAKWKCYYFVLWYSLALTIRVRVGHFFVCHHSCCCIVHLFKATNLLSPTFYIYYPDMQDGPKASSKPRQIKGKFIKIIDK